MKLLRILKLILIIPAYLFLALAGFSGGIGDRTKDKWDELYKWAKK